MWLRHTLHITPQEETFLELTFYKSVKSWKGKGKGVPMHDAKACMVKGDTAPIINFGIKSS